MPSAFKSDANGPYIFVDPGSDLDYTITSWLEGLLFTSVTWVLAPAVAGALHDPSINTGPVVIDGVTYQAGELATTWVKNLVAGQTYELTAQATFSGSRIDHRTIRLICKEL